MGAQKQSPQISGVLSSFDVKWSREIGHLEEVKGQCARVFKIDGAIKEMLREKQRLMVPDLGAMAKQEDRVGFRARQGWS